jgi:predicted ATPase/DNA-binding SARP family transcriptional activator
MEAGIEFRVLGQVEAFRGGEGLQLGGRRQRALLSLLLLNVGRPVAADLLIDELWYGESPSGASTLPSYVSRLRAVLGPTVPITGGPAGYSLDASPGQVDAARFERLVRQGHEALIGGKPQRAAERLHTALELWRGRPFGDVGDEGVLRAAAQRLEELRLSALEDRFQADLDLGSAAELVDDLESLVREHPFRERLWGHLMLALYRAQRQADALEVYRRARRALAENLGIEPSPELERLQRAILRREVPRALPPELRHNLPAPLTSFIGREAELADLESLLAGSRMLSLTGLGGVGKTRLALQAAARVLPDFADGVVFVDLSSIGDPGLVARQAALALRVEEPDAKGVVEHLAAHLRDRSLLLVLDNCEHLREACAGLAAALLQASPGLRILATSREVLGTPGEVDYAVQPLSVPRPGSSSAELRASESVRLFLDRARAVKPRLVDDDGALAAAARICADLEGLPLAIELAAARTKALSFDEIASRLADRFRFLVAWRRLSSARHRTLLEAMDWSFDLLGDDERGLLARLSVFAGAFTLEAAASVCLGGDREGALALIERLVGASLVVPEQHVGETHYRLLETVRQYAAQKLTHETAANVRRTHASYFLKLAETADLSAIRRRTTERLDVAIGAQDNLRSALAWAVESGSVAFGVELATALERFWVTHDPNEGIRWFAALLERPQAAELDPALRANALRAYGGALDIAGRDGDAEARWREGLTLFRELGDRDAEAVMLHRLAIAAMRKGDLVAARELVDASLAIHQDTGNRWGLAQAIGTLGAIHRDEGDTARAVELIEQSAELAHEFGSRWWETGMLAELAHLDLEAGDVDRAEARARQALARFQAMGDRAGMVFGVGLLARVAAVRGKADRAARLLAAVESDSSGAPLGGWRRHRGNDVAVIRAALGSTGVPDDLPIALEGAVAEALRT